MKKTVSIFILLFFFTFLFTFLFAPFSASAQGVDTILGGRLVQCDGPNCDLCELSKLAKRVLDFLVAFTVVAATVMFTWAGILYVTAGPNPGQIEKAHKIFWNVLIGLVAVLIAWLVIDTIMKTLVAENGVERFGPWNQILCLKEPGVGGPLPPPGEPGGPPLPGDGDEEIGDLPEIGPGSFCVVFDTFKQCYNGIKDCLDTAYVEKSKCVDRESNVQIGTWLNGNIVGCDACEPLFGTIPSKGPGVACSSNTCSVTDSMNTKLANLKDDIEKCKCPLKGNWWVTETFAPTVPHDSPCHYDGNCVDANIINPPTAAEIQGFVERANKHGLDAKYEVQTGTDKNFWVENGVPANYIIVTGTKSPHFHVKLQ